MSEGFLFSSYFWLSCWQVAASNVQRMMLEIFRERRVRESCVENKARILLSWQGWLAGRPAGQNAKGVKRPSVGPTRKLAILGSCCPGKAGWLECRLARMLRGLRDYPLALLENPKVNFLS